MATQTPNIGLTKQAQNEYNHNPVLNSNLDIVDSKIGQVPSGKSVQEEIGDLSNLTTTDKSSLVAAANELNSNKANVQKGQLSTSGTTLAFSLIDSCLVYVSRTTSGLAAVYAVDYWGVKQVGGDANVANITVSGSTITVTRGSALTGNAFVTVIG